MKNIINWTLGGFFRSFGRILCYIVIGALIGLLLLNNDIRIPSWLKIMRVNAETVDYTVKNYRVQYYALFDNTSAWNNWTTFGTSSSLSDGYGVRSIAARFGWSTKFQAGTTYRVVIEAGYSPGSTIPISFLLVDSFNCYGSSSTSSWSNDASLLSECNYVGATRVTNSNHVKYVFDVVPLSTIAGLQFNLNFGGTSEVHAVNVYSSSTITYGESVSGAIDEQTIIIQDEFNNLEDVINENNTNLINIINQNNQTCEAIVVSLHSPRMESGAFNSACRQVSSSTAKVSPYYRLSSTSTITGLRSGGYACFYDDTKTVIGSRVASSASAMTIPSNAKYVRFQVPVQTYEFFNVYTCQSNTDSTNSHIDDLTDTLTDTDTSSDSNSIYDAMYNFNLSIEGPLSTIIRLPIDLLDTLLIDYNDNERHADLCTTFRGQEICLPSGDIVWKRSGCHDNSPFGCPDYNAFKTFFQLVAGGGITYFLLKRLIKTIEKGLDPTKSEVNLMRL